MYIFPARRFFLFFSRVVFDVDTLDVVPAGPLLLMELGNLDDCFDI